MIIVGAGNLGKHILDQLLQDKYTDEILFFDEQISDDFIYGTFRIIHDWKTFDELIKMDQKFIIAIGNSRKREKMFLKIKTGNYRSVISTHVNFISTFCTIDTGAIIQPGCCISHNVIVGNSVILHANTLVGHDVTIGNFATIGSNVNILKGVNIGEYSTISPNVLIYPNIKIGRNVFIAPGAIVKTDIEDYTTVCD